MIQEIQFNIDGESHEIGVDVLGNKARMTKSLLMTQDLTDIRCKLWNQAIDVIESGIIIFVANGGNITYPPFVEMVKGQVTMLKRRLGL